MLLTKVQKTLVLIVIGTFFVQLLGLPSEGYAQWRDKSDDLPGINEGPSPLVYVAVALAAIGIIYVIVKNKKTEVEDSGDGQPKKEEETDPPNSSYLDLSSRNSIELSSVEDRVVNNNRQSSIEPFLGLQNDADLNLGFKGSDNTFKDKMLIMGLTVNF